VQSYLINKAKVPGLTQFPDTAARQLKAMAVEYQKSRDVASLASCIVYATYNYHFHKSSSCFGKAGKIQNHGNIAGTKQKHETNYECRYSYTQQKKVKTTVQSASETPVRRFSWNGDYKERYIKEASMCRHAYDAFQNVSCHAISHLKLTCNTNISAIMPGPDGQFAFKYHLKGA
jgi:thiol:disulfide interchange protein